MSNRYQRTIDLSLENNTHAALIRFVGEGRRVLELGASSGYMTSVLRARGNTVTAVEQDALAYEVLREVADDAVLGDLNDASVFELLDGQFDVILAGDVLEHLLDPTKTLSLATQRLREGGDVVISVPNVAHIDLKLALLQGRFDYRPTGLLDATHTRFFTYESLISMLDECGLFVTEIERIRVAAFETELAVERDALAPEVIDAALRAPEAETYQFVVRAAPVAGSGAATRRAAARQLRASREQESRRLAVMCTEGVGRLTIAGVAAVLEATERERDVARVHVTALDRQVVQLSIEAESARAEAALVTAELHHARGDVARLVTALETAEAEAALTTAELHHAQDDVARLAAALETATQKLTTARRTEAETRTIADVMRQELFAACVAETRAQQAVAQLEAEALDVASADRAQLTEILGSRAWRLVARYRRAVNHALPAGSRRRALLRPLNRLFHR